MRSYLFIFILKCDFWRYRVVCCFEWISAQFWFLLEEKFTAPSVLRAVDRLGSEAVVTTGNTSSRGERGVGGGLTFKGQAESAGRKQPFNRAGIQRRRIIKL